MTLLEYVELMRLQALPPAEPDSAIQVSTPYALLLNHRLMRNFQSFVVSETLKKIVEEIREPQEWMVLTEPSCGDSSQLVPIIARIAECNALIKLDFVLRDQHPEIMDAYLTAGKRGIPKLVAFDLHRNELFRWGPRPRQAQDIFEEALKDGHPKQVALERVHLFYAKDKGLAAEREFLQILGGLAGGGRKLRA
jgi:hypothetical protein